MEAHVVRASSCPQSPAQPDQAWTHAVDPLRVARAYAGLLVEDFITPVTILRRLLAPWLVLPDTVADREALRAAGGATVLTGPVPRDPFDRPGPLHLVPNWPRPLVWDASLVLIKGLYGLYAFDALEAMVAAVRERSLLPAHEAYPELQLAAVRARQFRPDEALALTDRMLATFPDMPPTRRASALHNRAIMLEQLGRVHEARENLREAVALFRLGNEAWYIGQSLQAQGLVEVHAFSLREGIRHLEEGRDSLRTTGQRWGLQQATFNLAIACYKSGRPSRSLEVVDEVEEAQRVGGALQGWLLTRLVRAKALMVRGDALAAADVARRVVPDARRMDWEREIILAWEVQGDAALSRGQRRRARRFYRKALVRAVPRAPRGDLVAGLLRRLGQERQVAGDLSAALRLLAAASHLATQAGDIFEEVVAHRLLAASRRRVGAFGEAWHAARHAIDRARFHGAELELARALLEGARVQAAWTVTAPESRRAGLGADAGSQGSLETAWGLAAEARELITGLKEFSGDLAACDSFLRETRALWRADLVWRGEEEPEPGLSAAAVAVGRDFVAESPAMIRVARLLALAAGTDDPVLICGETGTGKEVAARRIHALSSRSSGPFVAVNCGAVPAQIFEREFFGHARGAFSGADESVPGLVEQADRGVLLLDEIGELAFSLQPKLLRLLQEGTFRRLGDPVERRCDLRVLAATNADLVAMIARGEFRRDLFFRLQGLEVRLPPIRERAGDLARLAGVFARRAVGEDVDPAVILGRELWDAVLRYRWPGNVRELAGFIRRACLYRRVGRELPVEMLPRGLRELVGSDRTGGSAVLVPSHDLRSQLADTERTAIHRALSASAGNRTRAARLLGISRKALYDKLRRLGIELEGE